MSYDLFAHLSVLGKNTETATDSGKQFPEVLPESDSFVKGSDSFILTSHRSVNIGKLRIDRNADSINVRNNLRYFYSTEKNTILQTTNKKNEH